MILLKSLAATVVVLVGTVLTVAFGHSLELVQNTYGFEWAVALFVLVMGGFATTIFYVIFRDA